jgi:hypothetical protein
VGEELAHAAGVTEARASRAGDVARAPASGAGGASADVARPLASGAAGRFLLVAGIVLLTRLPFVGPGYGADPDAWRVAWAARAIATTGHYEASRFPGYPLQEYVSALAWRGGPLALNGLSALFSALGAGCFALTLRRLGVRDDVLAAVALASAPAIFLASVTAMDYVWALGFALLALELALRGRVLAAGVFAGLAVGCRIPAACWIPPLGIVLARIRPPAPRNRDTALFFGVALIVATLVFVPVLLTYGPGFLRFYQHGYPRVLWVVKNASVDLWGLPGTVAIALACGALLVRSWRNRAQNDAVAAGAEAGRFTSAWVAGLAICVVAYLRLPIKAFYLIPAVPFTLLLLAPRLPRPWFVAVCLALVASPWVLKVSEAGRPDSLAPTHGTVTVQNGGRTWFVDLLRGPVLADHKRRALDMDYVEACLARARRLPGESVVVAYDWLPQIRVRLHGKREGSVEYVYLLTREELAAFRARGVAVYDLAGADAENEKVNGVSLRESGSRALEAVE